MSSEKGKVVYFSWPEVEGGSTWYRSAAKIPLSQRDEPGASDFEAVVDVPREEDSHEAGTGVIK